MSSHPVGPREFNPALGGIALGVGVTAKVTFDIIEAIQDHQFVKHKLVPQCQKILELSSESRDRMISMSRTFQRSELGIARKGLVEVAEAMNQLFMANFEPEVFSRSVREAGALGERPHQLMYRWCQQFVASALWYLDKIQATRMVGREHRAEWRALEEFKQEIVDLWGKEVIDVSRSEGRERNYVLWHALKVLAKFGGATALAFGALVLVASLP